MTMIALGLLLLGLAGRPLRAIEVTARADRSVVYLGDEAIFQIAVEGSSGQVAEPILLPASTFRLRGPDRSASSQMSIVNGRMTQRETVTFTYAVLPLKEGDLVIPSATIDVDGTSHRTKPVLLKVTRAPKSDDFLIVQEASKLDPYEREPFTVSVRFLISKSCDTPVFRIPFLSQEGLVAVLPRPLPNQRTAQLGVEMQGRGVAVPFVQSQVTQQGEEFQAYVLTYRLYALAPGRLELGPISTRLAYEAGTEMRRGFFGMERVAKKENAFVVSDPLTLDIKPLPAEGRPATFTGAVGKTTIEVEANPSMVNVGQPIDVRIHIRGEGLLSAIASPDLSRVPGMEDGFKISQDLVEVTSADEEGRSFTQTLRARSAEVREIPSLSLDYFDPETGRYAAARSAPVPLDVRSVDEATGGDMERTGGREVSRKTDVKSLTEGIAELHTGLDSLEDQSASASFRGLSLLPWIAPPVLYFGLFLLLGRRRRLLSDTALARRKGARRGAVERLDAARAATVGAERCDLVARGLCSYIGDRTNTPAAGLTADEAARRLEERGFDAALVDRVRDLLQECDLGRFAAAGGSDGLLEKAGELLRDLERARV
jgi:hypothetical protein